MVLKSISESLFSLFHENSDDVHLEVLKSLGNLTRCPRVLQSMIEFRMFKPILQYTNFPDELFRQAALGVVINISGNKDAARTLCMNGSTKQDIVMQQLLGLLRRTTITSLESSTLICQVRCDVPKISITFFCIRRYFTTFLRIYFTINV